MTDQKIIRAVEDHAYSQDCKCQRCWGHHHDCDTCRGCELKPGCQTETGFGCQVEEKQRRGQISPLCRLCGERTPNVVNIRRRAVPVCLACVIAITRQEVASCGRRDAATNAVGEADQLAAWGWDAEDDTVPLEIADPREAYQSSSPHWGSHVSPVAQRVER